MKKEKDFYKPLVEKVRLMDEGLCVLSDSDMRKIVSKYEGRSRASTIGENYVIPLYWNVDLVFNPWKGTVRLEGRHFSFSVNKYRDEKFLDDLFETSNHVLVKILKDMNNLRSDKWRREKATLQTTPKKGS